MVRQLCQHYLERAVRQLIYVQDLALFQRFLRVCAHHVGQLVNLTQIANDCGISQKTVEAWLCRSQIRASPEPRSVQRFAILAGIDGQRR